MNTELKDTNNKIDDNVTFTGMAVKELLIAVAEYCDLECESLRRNIKFIHMINSIKKQ
jgi:hypothetical protein